MVFVLGKNKKPLMPCTERRARILLNRRRAVVVKRYPFTIRLKDRREGQLQPLMLALDPGSKISGIAISRMQDHRRLVLMLFELVHRGLQIRDNLTARASLRRGRRNRKTRYRSPRFLNRAKSRGWLAPSLTHRIQSILNWISRFRKLAPITDLAQELVRFDTQALVEPEIHGIQYQKGTLAGYEVREYLLEKWGRACVYCKAQNIPLEMDHVRPLSRGGSNRVSNLVLACRSCNQAKGNQNIETFLEKKPHLLRTLLPQLKTPLKDAAAVNSTRWQLYQKLKNTGLPVEVATGGRTKFNRNQFAIPKSHALDAACVGQVGSIFHWQRPTLTIRSNGRGSYQRTRLSKDGFPRGYLTRFKSVHGFQTGDLVQATVPKGRHQGIHRGRVAIRTSGSFNIQTPSGVIQGISYRYCRLIQRSDGYSYSVSATLRKEIENQGTLRVQRYPSMT